MLFDNYSTIYTFGSNDFDLNEMSPMERSLQFPKILKISSKEAMTFVVWRHILSATIINCLHTCTQLPFFSVFYVYELLSPLNVCAYFD